MHLGVRASLTSDKSIDVVREITWLTLLAVSTYDDGIVRSRERTRIETDFVIRLAQH